MSEKPPRKPRFLRLSVVLLIFLLSEIPVFYAGFYMGLDKGEATLRDSHQTLSEMGVALNQCTEEITGVKPHLFNYAVSLEEENARLNAVLRECRTAEK